ncbi:MAG: bifunctional phosphoglucose/phosphomannose isomerase [Anaerolineae bacterium]|nr:bifunctional phosphoglucose/phosphomannose isomerase [Anaerolineae bacterium]
MTTPFDLDDRAHLHTVDVENMLGHINALPKQFEAAWQSALQQPLPTTHQQPKQIVLCGMGGSAIGGDLIAALISATAPVPFVVLRGYDLPAFVTGPETLVITSSNSGNTEETLAATEQALARGVQLLAISTGGTLAKHAAANDYPLWQFTYKSQPRAALGWSFGLLIGLAHRLGLAVTLEADLDEALTVMREHQTNYSMDTPTANNPAKGTANWLFGTLPVCFGSSIFEPVARRWKGQLNENSKVWAQYEPMPETNHNAVASVAWPASRQIATTAWFLTSPKFDHPRVTLRNQLTAQLCEDAGMPTATFTPRGQSALAQMCHAIQFGDYVSYYVALAYGADPTAIAQIMTLKAQMAKA